MAMTYNKMSVWQTESGISLLEMVISVLVLMIIMLASTKVIGHQSVMKNRNTSRFQAMEIANNMMEQVKTKGWWDENTRTLGDQNGHLSVPANSTNRVLFGPDLPGEGDKTLYDDIDDFDGLIEQPPRDENDVPIMDLRKFKVIVDVSYVEFPLIESGDDYIIDPLGVGVETDFKRVRINVYWNEDRENIELRRVFMNFGRNPVGQFGQ